VASWAATPVDARSLLVRSWCGSAALEARGRLVVVVGCSGWAVLAVASCWVACLGLRLLGVADGGVGAASLESSSSANIVLLTVWASLRLRIADGGVGAASLESSSADVVLLAIRACLRHFWLGIADSGIGTASLEAIGADIVLLVVRATSGLGILRLWITDSGVGTASLESSSADIVLLTVWARFCLRRWEDGWDPSRGLIADCCVGGATLESVRADVPVSMSSWTAAPVLARPVLIFSGGGGASLEAAGGLVVDVGSACRAGGRGCACVDRSSD